MYFTVYKITNKINGKEYIGAHKTADLDDDYMGSGKHLTNSQKKYGLENFSKEIIFRAVSSEAMYFIERMLVDEEYVARKDTYNIAIGGLGGVGKITGSCVVKDINGNRQMVSNKDERYLSGELKHNSRGMAVVKNIYGQRFSVSVNDERYISGELVGVCKGYIRVKDKNGNQYHIPKNDERYISGEFVHNCKGLVVVKDNNGNTMQVSVNDERYISGELVHERKGFFTAKDFEGNIYCIQSDDERYIKGDLKHIAVGLIWMYNLELQQIKRVKQCDKEDFLHLGWIIGRKSPWTKKKIKVRIYNSITNTVKYINYDETIPDGWTNLYRKN